MKVLLREDVEHLGFAGEVQKVTPGFGRNYLLPRGLAELATPVALRKANAWRERAELRRAQIRSEHQALSAKISTVVLQFEAKAGTTGKLYGSITVQDLADALNKKIGLEIDRRKIEADSLRHVGEYKIPVRLDKDHIPEFTVIINVEGAAAAAAAAEAAAQAAIQAAKAAELTESAE